MNVDIYTSLTVNNSNFSSNNPQFLKNKPEIRRYIIKGSRRLSNFWWATIVFLGSFGFLVTGISSYFGSSDPFHLQDFANALLRYENWQQILNKNLEPITPLTDSSINKVELPTILFFPQGLVMCFYGVLGLFLSFYLWFTIFLNIGAGFNEIYINGYETKQVSNSKTGVEFYEEAFDSINKKKNPNMSDIKTAQINSLKNSSSINKSMSSSTVNKTGIKKFQKNSNYKSEFIKTNDMNSVDNLSFLKKRNGTPIAQQLKNNISKNIKLEGQIRIFRWGFPGKNRKIDLQYPINQVSAIKLEFLQGFNSKRTISLKLSDQREILLTGSPQGDWETFEQLEKQASDLAKHLKVNLELLS